MKQSLSLLIVLIMLFGCSLLKRKYIREVKEGMERTDSPTGTFVTMSDLDHLPLPVRKYLILAGVLNKSKIRNFKVTLEGKLRQDANSPWMKFSSVQYNFMDVPTRLFYMKAIMKGLPVRGFHCFKDGSAFMDIRLFSLFKVQYQKGPEMNVSETVTFFNDMCCLAPATLIDKNIQWTTVDDSTVIANFTHNKITISAELHFNKEGELVDFISENRYALQKDGSMKRLRWSTPLKDYKIINAHRLPGYAEAIYAYPEGNFCYGVFNIVDVEYNCKRK